MHKSENFSYWERKTFLTNIDVIIIGAGIVGYSTAIQLKKQNPELKIVILERGLLPSGASSKNAGFACFGSATEIYTDLQTIPEKEVWETVKQRWDGLQELRNFIHDDKLKLETHGSWDLITEKEKDLFSKTIEKIPYFNEKLEEITGIKNVYSIDDNVSRTFNFSGIETSIYNKLEGQIDTASMNDAFYKKVISLDIKVLFGVEVLKIENNLAITNQGELQAKRIAICTNGFAKQFLPKQSIQPARAQVIITEPIKNLSIKGTFHYDCGYYYFRNIDNRILFGGGRNLNFEAEETTEIKNTDEITSKLKEILKTVILPTTEFKIDHQWAGIMGVGDSKKPIIEQVSAHLFCGVRLGGMGVAIGTLVGKQVADLILAQDFTDLTK